MVATERQFRYVDGLATIKERNAAVRELEAEGFECDPGGSKRGGYSVEAWQGEKPAMMRHAFNLREGGHTVTPMYRRADGNGFEYMDGTPQYND